MYIYPKEIHLGEGEISGIGPHEWYLGSLTVFLKSHHKTNCWSFPGGPVAKTSCSQCRGPRFYPYSGK